MIGMHLFIPNWYRSYSFTGVHKNTLFWKSKVDRTQPSTSSSSQTLSIAHRPPFITFHETSFVTHIYSINNFFCFNIIWKHSSIHSLNPRCTIGVFLSRSYTLPLASFRISVMKWLKWTVTGNVKSVKIWFNADSIQINSNRRHFIEELQDGCYKGIKYDNYKPSRFKWTFDMFNTQQ